MRLINLILKIITINSVPFGILNPFTIISSVVSLEPIKMAAWQPIRFPPVQRKLRSRFDENAKVLIDSAVKAVNFTQLPMIRVCQILIN